MPSTLTPPPTGLPSHRATGSTRFGVMARKPSGPLRRGWTTGACATAAARAAYAALVTGAFPDPVSITLPKGETPAFPLARESQGEGWAEAGIVKDAGDDPDVTHGALILVRVAPGPAGSGVRFRAGEGVGTVTRPGLPIPPGETGDQPGTPRRLMTETIAADSAMLGGPVDVEDHRLGPRRRPPWRRRPGIPASGSSEGCRSWVRPAWWCRSAAPPGSIRSTAGVDVARANGFDHVAGCTGFDFGGRRPAALCLAGRGRSSTWATLRAGC